MGLCYSWEVSVEYVGDMSLSGGMVLSAGVGAGVDAGVDAGVGQV